MICNNCGEDLKVGTTFCGLCGTEVDVQQTTQQVNNSNLFPPQGTSVLHGSGSGVISAPKAPASTSAKSPIGKIAGIVGGLVLTGALIAVIATSGGGGGSGGNNAPGSNPGVAATPGSGQSQQPGGSDNQGPSSNNSSIVDIAAVLDSILGLRADGTIAYTDMRSGYVPAAYNGWQNIAKLNSDVDIVGLLSDRTVMVEEQHAYFDEVRGWTDVVQAVSANGVVVGLKSDGTVVVAGHNVSYDHILLYNDFTNITSIAKSHYATAFIRSDGVVNTLDNYMFSKDRGGNFSNLKSIFNHNDVIELALVGYTIYGLRADGTVLQYSNGRYEEPDGSGVYFANDPNAEILEGWSNIASITADTFLAGIKKDGTLVVHGNIPQGMADTISSPEWSGITTVSLSTYGQTSSIVALKSDGTILSTRWNYSTNEEEQNFDFTGW